MNIPREIHIEIFGFLTLRRKYKIREVCLTFKKIIEETFKINKNKNQIMKDKLFKFGYDFRRCPFERKNGWRCKNEVVCIKHKFGYMRCIAILKTGKNKGKRCDALIEQRKYYCRRHQNNPVIINGKVFQE